VRWPFEQNFKSRRALIFGIVELWMMTKRGDPRGETVRLQERIEELAAKIENCRKFILASRIAI
jgi:hypothetical protein